MKNKTLLEGFIHLRPENRIHLLEKINVNQALTIAYKLNKTPSGSSLLIGVSVCSKKDQFCKKTGREIAYGRMMKRSYGTEEFKDIDTKVFKSEKGRQALHEFILDTYITDVPADCIKRHIHMVLNGLY